MTDISTKRQIDLSQVMKLAAQPLAQNLAARADLTATTGAAAPTDLPVPLPATVVDWLTQACLLHGMPFEYIIPDARMLPPESIRFFYIDRNWLHRLVQGAVSVGVAHTGDTVQTLGVIDQIVDQAISNTANTRDTMRGQAADVTTGSGAGTTDQITGFLLRSSVVSGWPGTEVSAYSSTTADASTQLKLLRLDRVSDAIMIALFQGVPKLVQFLQPPESLHFGIRPEGSTFYSFIRGLGYGGHDPGIQIDAVEVPITMRGDATYPGVVDVAKTAAALKAKLKAENALDPQDTFTSAEFAVQMVRAAGLQDFQWGASQPPKTGE